MKASVCIGYTYYVLDIEKAIELVKLLSDAEIFEQKWSSETKQTTFHIYSQGNNSEIKELKLITDSLYNMAKLAGKPVGG